MNAVLLFLHLIPISTPPSIDRNSALPLSGKVGKQAVTNLLEGCTPYLSAMHLFLVNKMRQCWRAY